MVRFARPVSICESCRWYEPRMEMEGPHGLREPIFTPACRAYPEGIPAPIFEGGFDHRGAYFGDGGRRWQFDPRSGFNFLDYLSDVENGAFPDRNLVIEGGGEHEPLFRNGASLNVVRPNA